MSGTPDIAPSSRRKQPTGPLIVEERPCAKCGYSLQGLRIGGACPECGEAIRAEEAFEVAGGAKPERRRRRDAVQPIGEERPCPGCGYDLKGLQLGGVCPECGRTITFATAAKPRATFLDAPIPYIRLMHAAMIVMTFGMVVGIGSATSRSWLGAAAEPLMVAASAAWFAGLVVVAWPGPRTRAQHNDDSATLHRWMAIAACVSQAAWIAVAALNAFPTAGMVGDWGVRGLAAFGALGFIPTAWTLGQVAEWAGDDDRARLLELVSIWVLVFGALSLAGVGIELPIIVPIPGVYWIEVDVLWLSVWVGIGYAFWSVVKLTTVLGWGVRRAVVERERTEEFVERFQRERAAGAAAHDHEPFGGPVAPPVGSMWDVRKPPRG